MNNKIALESLAMDLKRVALGYYRNSSSMGDRFYQEALKRKEEVDVSQIKPYMKKVFEKIDLIAGMSNEEIAENALLLSTLVQNYAIRFFSV